MRQCVRSFIELVVHHLEREKKSTERERRKQTQSLKTTHKKKQETKDNKHYKKKIVKANCTQAYSFR